MTRDPTRPEAPPVDDPSTVVQGLIVAAERAWATRFGQGARAALTERVVAHLGSRKRAPMSEDEIRSLLRDAEVDLVRIYGARRLAAELADERDRCAAVTSDAGLVAYEKKWGRRIARLQRAYPSRWRLPGLSDEELRDELTLRLIDAVRSRPDELAPHLRAGKEWGALFLIAARNEFRRRFRLRVELADLSPVLDRGESEEERLIEEQNTRVNELARSRAEGGLSSVQRRWWSAMRLSARTGSFFESSGNLNLSAVARWLDKDRSSAKRAFEQIQIRFLREREKIDP